MFTCTEPVEQSVSRLTGDAAVRALTVDTLLTWTLQGVLTLVHIWSTHTHTHTHTHTPLTVLCSSPPAYLESLLPPADCSRLPSLPSPPPPAAHSCTKMSQCRKRCKRQLTKVARYFYHFLMGTLTQGRHPKKLPLPSTPLPVGPSAASFV